MSKRVRLRFAIFDERGYSFDLYGLAPADINAGVSVQLHPYPAPLEARGAVLTMCGYLPQAKAGDKWALRKFATAWWDLASQGFGFQSQPIENQFALLFTYFGEERTKLLAMGDKSLLDEDTLLDTAAEALNVGAANIVCEVA